ncbi:CBS domain-containing protein [Enterococcus durans]|uniref:CBS domain-containing protein n=1 Tax=Enterococcus durans TaxID=53345 RepID=A0A5N0YT74_9ENTE|nr:MULTISPECIES: CBS domain-containing protein [Enterococcus]KAA9178979.1 CBS domain-containing protein [Enterococcus durans]KAA9185554.1 CBS domain-containing protein [Enterococcus durans]KAA9186605.1 CBS domain-containing protein [Enterococcus durans]KAA9191410.1 CBS domain-containing protein [Enterococcus durans]KAA9193480.1 CBS domain-containing protein [Enterococcus durans]
MSVKDFMTKELVVVAPQTKIFDAVDLMKKYEIHRLPVVENNSLIGLITEGTIQAAMPSQATSLSVFEINYLLNKTTVNDVMIRDVQTIAPNDLLEDAIYLMRKKNIGVLPVVDMRENLVGIITNNDIFDAFLKITGYTDGGTRIQLRIEKDQRGVLAEVCQVLSSHGYNITTVVVNRNETETIIEFQISTQEVKELKEFLEAEGYTVLEAMLTNVKK